MAPTLAQIQNRIDTGGYGLFLCSLETLSAFLASRRIKTRKLAAYLDGHKDVGEEAICSGAVLPIKGIASMQHEVIVSAEEADPGPGWKVALTFGPFNLDVGGREVWLCNMEQLRTWDPSRYAGVERLSYSCRSGPEEIPVELNTAIRLPLGEGRYEVMVSGLSRVARTSDGEDFGFLFRVRSVAAFTARNNPLEEGTYPFGRLYT